MQKAELLAEAGPLKYLSSARRKAGDESVLGTRAGKPADVVMGPQNFGGGEAGPLEWPLSQLTIGKPGTRAGKDYRDALPWGSAINC